MVFMEIMSSPSVHSPVTTTNLRAEQAKRRFVHIARAFLVLQERADALNMAQIEGEPTDEELNRICSEVESAANGVYMAVKARP